MIMSPLRMSTIQNHLKRNLSRKKEQEREMISFSNKESKNCFQEVEKLMKIRHMKKAILSQFLKMAMQKERKEKGMEKEALIKGNRTERMKLRLKA